MEAVKVIGHDIAKSVFQVHGIDAEGKVIMGRQLRRRHVLPFFQKLPPCLVGIEACASSHHWSRELQALGHTVRLMPAAYVKPDVKRHKNDATYAAAICEAVTRPNMRFVATKTPEQQSCLTLHRTRHHPPADCGHQCDSRASCRVRYCRASGTQRRRGSPPGRRRSKDKRVPKIARALLAALDAQLRMLKVQILEFNRMINAWHRSNKISKELDEIPGVGPALATALVAGVADSKAFRSVRDFSAWIGLVLKQHSSGERSALARR
jgi:transposase